MDKYADKDHTALDYVSFVENTEIGPTGKRGRGLFSTKYLGPGDVVLIEKTFYVAHEDFRQMPGVIDYDIEVKVVNGIVEKLRWNPQQAAKYLDLFDGGTFENKDAKTVDGMVVVDIFQVQAIAVLNSFCCPNVKSSDLKERDGEDGTEAAGVWLHAARTNHSCLPNAVPAFIGDMMIIRAIREIPAGEEILMSYFPDRDIVRDFYKRREYSLVP